MLKIVHAVTCSPVRSATSSGSISEGGGGGGGGGALRAKRVSSQLQQGFSIGTVRCARPWAHLPASSAEAVRAAGAGAGGGGGGACGAKEKTSLKTRGGKVDQEECFKRGIVHARWIRRRFAPSLQCRGVARVRAGEKALL